MLYNFRIKFQVKDLHTHFKFTSVITFKNLQTYLHKNGYQIIKSFYKKNKSYGILGSHCDEILAKKVK